MNKYNLTFSNNLKILRQTYELSATELANRLGFKYGSTISEFEKGKNTPSFNTLISLADFFGVTIDWLVGRSSVIYTEATISESESLITQRTHKMAEELDGHCLTEESSPLWNILYPEYADLKKRKIYYSLSVRANIAVLMKIGWLPAMYWSMYYGKYGLSKNAVMNKVKEILHIPKETKIPVSNNKKFERGKNMRDLLKLKSVDDRLIKSTTPIYDVEAAYQQLQQEMKEKETEI